MIGSYHRDTRPVAPGKRNQYALPAALSASCLPETEFGSAPTVVEYAASLQLAAVTTCRQGLARIYRTCHSWLGSLELRTLGDQVMNVTLSNSCPFPERRECINYCFRNIVVTTVLSDRSGKLWFPSIVSELWFDISINCAL